VNVEKKRAGQDWMNQVLAHRIAEAVHHYHGYQQRHEKIEILVQQARAFRSRPTRG
jgi:hypothetical protein